MTEWLDELQARGYGALGLELPHQEQTPLLAWADGLQETPPPAFVHPSGDGRANQQALELIREARHRGWELLCFSTSLDTSWEQRDLEMAECLLAEWTRACPQKKIVCVCGNMHSRLTPAFAPEKWPSFAANLQRLRPDTHVATIQLIFHQGATTQATLESLSPLSAPYLCDGASGGHTAELHLAQATPATHWRSLAALEPWHGVPGHEL